MDIGVMASGIMLTEINMKKTGPFRKIVYSKMTGILLFFFLSTFIVLSLWFDHKLNQSQKRRYLSYVAADELRQSSDDLTRMVRTYVVMKDPRYEKMYWDILAIRKGEKARPIRYENIYWDFIAFTNEKPRPDGQKISLLKIMEDLEFTREEFEKLAEAEKHSNDLVKTEMLAMHAMKGEFLDAEGEFTLRGVPDYDYAQSLLFGKSYHSDKVDIMAPIDEFFVMVNARTEAQVSRDTIYTYICIFLVCVTITLLLWLSRVELNERKLAEDDLRQSEKKFKDFMMSANEGFVLYNADLNLSEINDKALEIFPPESTKENLLGKNILDIALSLKETGRYDKYVAVKDTGEPLYFDDIIPDPIFGDRHLSIKAFKVGGGLGMIFSDISEQVKMAEELRQQLDQIKNLQQRIKAESIYLQEEIKSEHNFENIIGNSDALKYVLYRVAEVAPTDAPVLIMGETGTGKELVARAIHNASSRSKHALVKINCAALSASLIESELFGHEKGAFTGADARRMGRFQLADGATLFLDEISEIPLELQPKLLQVLQDGEFEPLGSSKTLRVDVRIIAASNRNLEDEVIHGRFRQDLFYRINMFPFTVPPLRHRKEDIPLLVNWFVDRFNRKMGKNITSIPPALIRHLQAYHWPGNVRELENVIERAVITSNNSILKLTGSLAISPNTKTGAKLSETLAEVERAKILNTLENTGWKIEGTNGAAGVLGLAPSTLRDRIKKLGIRRSMK